MRRAVPLIMVFLGAFLLCLAVFVKFYAFERLQKTPLDVNTETYLTGTAKLNTGEKVENVDVKAVSITLADSQRSDSDVVVFNNSTCLVRIEGPTPDCVNTQDKKNRLLSASTGTFATDRHTAMSVNDPEYLPPTAEPYDGLVNKYPFGAEKKTYPFWDGVAGQALNSQFMGVEQIDGLEVHKYEMRAESVPIDVAKGVKGTYDVVRTHWADPTTGALIRQSERQIRRTTDGELVIDVQLDFTDATIAMNVKDAKANGDKLHLVGTVIPPVLGGIGLLLLLVGILFGVRGARRSSEPKTESDVEQTTELPRLA